MKCITHILSLVRMNSSQVSIERLSAPKIFSTNVANLVWYRVMKLVSSVWKELGITCARVDVRSLTMISTECVDLWWASPAWLGKAASHTSHTWKMSTTMNSSFQPCGGASERNPRLDFLHSLKPFLMHVTLHSLFQFLVIFWMLRCVQVILNALKMNKHLKEDKKKENTLARLS